MGNVCGANSSKAPPNTTHSVYVKTGDKKGAGTDGNIYISLGDEEGVWSEEEMIDTKWKDDFEAGNTDIFHFKLPQIKRVVELSIRRDSYRAHDDWYLETVIIVNMIGNQSQSVFPVHRWIHANDNVTLVEYDSTLPQQEKHPKQREAELEKKRERYKLVEKIPGAPYQVEVLPEEEQFSNDYQWDLKSAKLKVFLQAKYVDLTSSKFTHLKDYFQLYRKDMLPVPKGAESWKSDEEFGNQRLAGCNPAMLRLCQTIPERIALTAEMVEPFLEGQTLQSCLEQKKIYMVDHSYMAEIKCAREAKMCGPTALFYSKKNGDLVPFAIQLMPQPADDNPVFLPSDPEYTWLVAKMWLNLADTAHHQSASHLGFTHLLMEMVAVCTHRQLSPSHPIFRLLAPHFLYLLAINDRAVSNLLAPGEFIDKHLLIGREGFINIMKKKWPEWNLKEDGSLPADLKCRGVDDVEALPNYHYRDDALLLWNALHKYVASVVNQVYDDSEKLSADKEVQSWALELVEANMKGIESSISSNEELIEMLTTFIYISSVSHAAVNFGQYDEYAFPPNYPVKLSADWPRDKSPLTEEYIMDALPSKSDTLMGVVVMKLLSNRGTNELTNFEVQYAFDSISLGALEQLKADLKEASRIIDERNVGRVRKYPYLNPRDVPNAISI